MMMEDTFVFIDDGYFSLISKHFGKGKHIKVDIKQFGITLAKENNLWCKNVFYYTAPPFQNAKPTPEQIKRRANHDKFIHKLKKIPEITIRQGRCQKIGGDYKQKGVDSLIIMDLFRTPQSIRTVILIACDTDFVPILNELRSRGMYVILYYFTDRVRNSKFSMSNHIMNACDRCVLLTEKHFKKSMFIGNK